MSPSRQGLPAPILGPTDTEAPPAHWANYIQVLDFGVARDDGRIKSDLLRWLTRQQAVREPVLRVSGFDYTATVFLHMLNSEISNVQSAYMQSVGHISPDPWESLYNYLPNCLSKHLCNYL